LPEKEGRAIKGLLFTQENLKLVFDWEKTHTRRTRGLDKINKQPDKWTVAMVGNVAHVWGMIPEDFTVIKPYYQPGETVYIQETIKRIKHIFDNGTGYETEAFYVFDGTIVPNVNWVWKRDVLSGMFLPKRYARKFAEITSVNLHRLHDMTEEDAKLEGINPEVPWGFHDGYLNSYAWEWDMINGKRYPWGGNYWCWDYGYELLDK